LKRLPVYFRKSVNEKTAYIGESDAYITWFRTRNDPNDSLLSGESNAYITWFGTRNDPNDSLLSGESDAYITWFGTRKITT